MKGEFGLSKHFPINLVSPDDVPTVQRTLAAECHSEFFGTHVPSGKEDYIIGKLAPSLYRVLKDGPKSARDWSKIAPAMREDLAAHGGASDTTAPTAGVSAAAAHGPRRRDIQGLRAVAILAVVAYHAGLPIPGGYVGVDVFFVISGYLITQLLWDEVAGGGRLSFSRFYARRARRLLPSAVLVIVVTVAVSVAVLGPLEATAVAKDAVACALYVGNYRFAFQATNYLDSQGPVSPLQNYWSLGVEEQFYLLWPALLLTAIVIAGNVGGKRRARHRAKPLPALDRSRWAVVAALTVVAVLSFWLCVHLTSTDEPWAFFSLPTRAWELAVGGLLALAAPTGRRLPDWALATIGWAGLGAVAWSFAAFGPQTPFPGTAALVPVAGAGAALIVGALQGCGVGMRGSSQRPTPAAGTSCWSTTPAAAAASRCTARRPARR